MSEMVPEAWRGGLVSTGRVVGVLLLLGALHKASAAVIRYEILEEREKGFVVGNVVRDLDLDLGSLSARRLRVVSGASRRFFEVNWETGELRPPKVPRHAGVHRGEHRGSRHRFL